MAASDARKPHKWPTIPHIPIGTAKKVRHRPQVLMARIT